MLYPEDMMPTIQRAYKTELDPNNAQRSLFESYAYVAMAVYNLAIREWQRQYEAGEKPNAYKLKREFNAIKHEKFPYIVHAPYAVTEAAFADVDSAYKHFFRRVKTGETPGYPREKRYISGFAIKGYRVEPDRVRMTGAGWVRLKERDYIPTTDSGLRFGTYGRVSLRAGRWYVSVQAEEPAPELEDRHALVLGIDFGIKSIAVCSNGKVFDNPRPLYEAERHLKRLQREQSRRKKGGANWRKSVTAVQKAQARVADLRRHLQHEISDYVTRDVRPRAIVIEDLNVSGMLSNHHLARAVADVGFYELRRQIEYKAAWLGIKVVIADRWFPSSKTCNRCGSVRTELSLDERTFVCPDCGFTLDRDLNAALNLAAYGRNRQTGGDCLGSWRHGTLL